MKYAICLLALLFQDRGRPTPAGGNYALTIDGTFCGWLDSVEGGHAVGNVVSVGGNNPPKKHLGGIRYEDLKISVRLPLPRPLQDWVNATWSGQAPRKSGSLVLCDFQRKPIEATDFRDALIRSVTIPAADASSKTVEPAVITLAIEESKKGALPASVNDASTPQSKFTASNFRVTIGGLDCSRIAKVDSFTVKMTISEDNAGEQRVAQKIIGKVEIPNLKFTMTDPGTDWKAWHEDFLIKGNCDDSKEKSGSIEFLNPTAKDALFKIDMSGLGICSLARDGSSRLVAEVYCEKLQFAAPGAATPETKEPAPKEETPPAANTNEKDEGDRDPKDLPRYENCIRKSFESYREKFYLDERGNYETKDSAKQIEDSLNKQLEKLGWELETRNESGEIKKGTNHVHMIYKKGPVYATFDIGPTTEGMTKYKSRYYDDFRLRKELPQRK